MRTRAKTPLWIAGIATFLMLGLPLEGPIPGRFLAERLFIVAAIVATAFAAAPGTTLRKSITLINVAIGSLAITAALVLANIAPSGAILLGIAACSLLWQKKLWLTT